MNRLSKVIQVLLIGISILGLLAHTAYRMLIGKEDSNSFILFLVVIIPLLPLFYNYLEHKISLLVEFKSKLIKRTFFTLTLLTFSAILYFILFSYLPYRYGYAIILLILLMGFLMVFNRLNSKES